jgi:hypothetical protein
MGEEEGKRKQKVRNEGGKERQIGARARGSHGDLKKETREGLFLVFSRFISCSLELQREQSGSLASHLALGKKQKTRKKRERIQELKHLQAFQESELESEKGRGKLRRWQRRLAFF